jgi:hypothetical protein
LDCDQDFGKLMHARVNLPKFFGRVRRWSELSHELVEIQHGVCILARHIEPSKNNGSPDAAEIATRRHIRPIPLVRSRVKAAVPRTGSEPRERLDAADTGVTMNLSRR